MSMHSTWMSFRSLTADQSVKNQKLRPGTLKRIASFAVPYKASLTLFLITVVIDAFLIVSTPLLLRKLIDDGVIPKNGFGEAIEAEELCTFLVQPFVLMPQIGVRHRAGAFFF